MSLLRSCRALLITSPVLLTLVAASPAFAGIESGINAIKAEDMPTAEKELQLLAKERDPRAQFLLGLYVYGNADSKLLDLSKAAPMLLDAAERGYTPAMIPLAGLPAPRARGVPKSVVRRPSSGLADRRALERAQRRPAARAGRPRSMKPEEIAKAKAKAAMAFTFKAK